MREVALVIVIALGLAGCPPIHSVVPVISDLLVVVQDATQILDAIEDFADSYFKTVPDGEKEIAVRRALAKTRSALNVALRTAHGVANLDHEKTGEAFAEFRGAYEELMVLVGPLGVTQGVTLGACSEPSCMRLAIPAPLAMQKP